MSVRVRRRCRGAAALVALGLAACGVTHDEAARPIDQVPFGLAEPTTTTSTLPPPVTTVPEPATTTTVAPTTTAAPTERVSFYYAIGDRIRPEYRFVPATDPTARLDALATLKDLQAGPVNGQTGLTNLVTPGLVEQIVVDRGRAEVWMAPAFLSLDPPVQLAIVAQLVMTFTDRPGVGRVVFRTTTEASLVVPRAGGGAGSDDATAEDYQALVD